MKGSADVGLAFRPDSPAMPAEIRRTVARPIPVPSNSPGEWRRSNTPKSLSTYLGSKPTPLSVTL